MTVCLRYGEWIYGKGSSNLLKIFLLAYSSRASVWFVGLFLVMMLCRRGANFPLSVFSGGSILIIPFFVFCMLYRRFRGLLPDCMIINICITAAQSK